MVASVPKLFLLVPTPSAELPISDPPLAAPNKRPAPAALGPPKSGAGPLDCSAPLVPPAATPNPNSEAELAPVPCAALLIGAARFSFGMGAPLPAAAAELKVNALLSAPLDASVPVPNSGTPAAWAAVAGA